MAGIDKKQTVFLFNDTQITKESQVEDICGILNNGEVPNLFTGQERSDVIEAVSEEMPNGTNNQKFSYFVKCCKENLHMVLCFSPVGESFRKRIRTFPSMVNCTTIDWFLPWPEEALRSTAETNIRLIKEITDEKTIQGLVVLCTDMQLRVEQKTKEFL